MPVAPLQADYLLVGAGAQGLAFADALVHESDATLVIVDRHAAPGGHWNDAYPFVRLHQPSSYYGVNSRPLGSDAKEGPGFNEGMYERASAAELQFYYQAVMQALLATGRVQYFAMSHYLGRLDNGAQGPHRFESLTSGLQQQVQVRKKLVDGSYFNTAVPATHPPKYAVAPGLHCVPLNQLPQIKRPHSGYVVVGAGKTGVDACLWLLEHGTPPERITWVLPRDAWFQNRARVQPGQDFFVRSYSNFVGQMEMVTQASSTQDLFARMEAQGIMLRLSPEVQPGMYHGAIMSEGELQALRRIPHMLRLGRVQRIEPTQIVLERGTAPSDPDRLYIDCSASAVERRPAVPVFGEDRITLQMVRTFQPTFSAALIGHLEAHYASDAEKNQLGQVIPMPDLPRDFVTMLEVNMANQHRWAHDKALRSWIERSRLDAFTALARAVQPHEADKIALLQRYGAGAAAAAARIPQLLAAAA